MGSFNKEWTSVDVDTSADVKRAYQVNMHAPSESITSLDSNPPPKKKMRKTPFIILAILIPLILAAILIGKRMSDKRAVVPKDEMYIPEEHVPIPRPIPTGPSGALQGLWLDENRLFFPSHDQIYFPNEIGADHSRLHPFFIATNVQEKRASIYALLNTCVNTMDFNTAEHHRPQYISFLRNMWEETVHTENMKRLTNFEKMLHFQLYLTESEYYAYQGPDYANAAMFNDRFKKALDLFEEVRDEIEDDFEDDKKRKRHRAFKKLIDDKPGKAYMILLAKRYKEYYPNNYAITFLKKNKPPKCFKFPPLIKKMMPYWDLGVESQFFIHMFKKALK